MASNKISILQFPLACLAKNFFVWQGGGLEDQWDRPYGHPVELEGPSTRVQAEKVSGTHYIRAEY